MIDQLNYEDFPQANQYMGKPKDWDEEKHGMCEVLPVYVTPDGVSLSKWKFSFKQRIKILFGHRVYLQVVGRQPPVALTVQK